MAAWPGTVPESVVRASYSEQIETNRAEFSPDVGPVILARRSTIATSRLEFQTFMTFAEYDLLDDFYRETLADGTATFTRDHPRTGVGETFQFISPPALVGSQANGYVVVSLSLRVMP